MSEQSDDHPLVLGPLTSDQTGAPLSSSQAFVPTLPDFNATNRDSSSAPSNVTGSSAGYQNNARSPSTNLKSKETELPATNSDHGKYACTIGSTATEKRTQNDSHRIYKTQFHTFDMTTQDDVGRHSHFQSDTSLCNDEASTQFQSDFLIDRMLNDDTSSDVVQDQRSSLRTPSSDYRDLEGLSDAETYVIEDEADVARDDQPEHDIEENLQQTTPVQQPLMRRYANRAKNRHGTFDIQGMLSAVANTIHRPIVDSNIPTRDRTSSSLVSHSAELDLNPISSPTEEHNPTHTLLHVPQQQQRPTSLIEPSSRTPPQHLIKPAESFVISPNFDTKPVATAVTGAPRRRVDAPTRIKPTEKPLTLPAPFSNSPPRVSMLQSSSPSSPTLPATPRQSDTEKYTFCLQRPTHQSNPKPSLTNSDYFPSNVSLRSHPTANDPVYGTSSSFQRNSSVRQTMPAHIQSNRPLSSVSSPSSSTAAGGGGAAATPIDHDQMDENSSSQLNLTKVFMNRSFTLRRQHANHLPTPTKSSPSIPNQGQALMAPSQQPPLRPAARQPLKPTASVPAPTSLITSNGQTNRAVELRRARAQAKIEELSQRTRKQLHKSDHQNDIMSASWHSNATSSNKKDPTNVRSNPRMSVKTNRSSQVQDMSKLSSPSHQRSSSTSPKPFGEATPQYRRAMVSSVIDEQQYRRMNGSVYANETDRCDSLRNDGQRLAIKLIQLSSGILEKLKPNDVSMDDDANVRELEQLVDKLQGIHRTLAAIDASLSDSYDGDAVL